MAAQVEVELGRVCDGAVHCGACWDVTALPNLQRSINVFMLLVNSLTMLCNRKQLKMSHIISCVLPVWVYFHAHFEVSHLKRSKKKKLIAAAFFCKNVYVLHGRQKHLF